MRIFNPTRKISLYGGQKFLIELPCGQCAECREARRTEIYFRTYYQCLYTWKNNGYVYFDTLTYRTSDLPHVSDFCYKIDKGSSLDYSCFNAEDVRLFLVRLRRELTYYGYNVKDNLKYFVASEYGSEQYTARPHYHILFFVTDPNLRPVELSKFVNNCWQHGRTDGIDYHDYNYLKQHIYGPGYNEDQVHMQAVCNYVAKYVLKDSEFENTLSQRIRKVFSYGHNDESWLDTFEGQKYYKKIMKFMRPYTRWSKGFGEYGLDYNTDALMLENKMRIPDKNSVWRYAPLSGYLSRKKYYETDYDIEGKLYWKMTDEGRKRALDLKIKGCEQFAERFDEWLSNLSVLMKKGDMIDDGYDFDKELWISRSVTSQDIFKFRKEIKEKVVKYLNGRSPLEFAVYLFFYKGRVKSNKQIYRESQGIYHVDDIYEFFNKGLICKQDFDYMPENKYLYNYCHSRDRKHFQDCIIGSKNLISKVEVGKTKRGYPIYEDGYRSHGFDYGYDNNLGKFYGKFVDKYNSCHSDKFESVSRWIKRNVITEDSDSRFKDFDKLYQVYCSSLQYYSKRKQEAYDYVEEIKRRLKNV